jgi:tRNA threonylcarbamoyladenosine biosynthesis protein TsaB
MTGMLALRRDAELLEERELEHARRRHAQTLVAEVRALLDQHKVRPFDVTLVAVSIGPGSFTGLRVGVVFAKTFAYATSAKLVAVDTLHAMALSAPDSIQRVWAVSDAQREQVFVGEYERVAQDVWKRSHEIAIRDNEDWISQVAEGGDKNLAVTGPGLAKIKDAIPTTVQVLSQDDWHPRASHIGIIGEQLSANNQFADLHSLEPFYLRKSAAEEKRDQAIQASPT